MKITHLKDIIEHVYNNMQNDKEGKYGYRSHCIGCGSSIKDEHNCLITDVETIYDETIKENVFLCVHCQLFGDYIANSKKQSENICCECGKSFSNDDINFDPYHNYCRECRPKEGDSEYYGLYREPKSKWFAHDPSGESERIANDAYNIMIKRFS